MFTVAGLSWWNFAWKRHIGSHLSTMGINDEGDPKLTKLGPICCLWTTVCNRMHRLRWNPAWQVHCCMPNIPMICERGWSGSPRISSTVVKFVVFGRARCLNQDLIWQRKHAITLCCLWRGVGMGSPKSLNLRRVGPIASWVKSLIRFCRDSRCLRFLV